VRFIWKFCCYSFGFLLIIVLAYIPITAIMACVLFEKPSIGNGIPKSKVMTQWFIGFIFMCWGYVNFLATFGGRI